MSSPVAIPVHRNGTVVESIPTLSPYDSLWSAIHNKTATVGIIGMGYVGLPLARAFSREAFPVVGFDIDQEKVTKLNHGISYIGHIPSDELARMREAGFRATAEFGDLEHADVIIICVATPLTESREPDLTFVENSTRAVARSLRVGQLVVLESTTYPGTTRDVVRPILEETGLVAGEEFFLAFSPEREDPGNPQYSTTTIPKVVGGLEPMSAALAESLYAKVVVRTVRVSSPEVAEACKILENTYRAVNIALVNELKVLYDRMGIDVWEVIDAAKTKPFGYQAFYPGPGLGGHCIPIDPFYLTWVARRFGLNTRFIELAGEVNTNMPHFVLDKIADALNEHGKPIRGSRITILGMAYKKDIDDCRESPGFELMDLLLKKGAAVRYNDPHIPSLPPTRNHPHLRMTSETLTESYLQCQDAVVIVTDHSSYDWPWIVANSPLVIDTRRAAWKRQRERLFEREDG
jgi:UDP-N-acetyl-D-glucosamine dehydrogenase